MLLLVLCAQLLWFFLLSGLPRCFSWPRFSTCHAIKPFCNDSTMIYVKVDTIASGWYEFNKTYNFYRKHNKDFNYELCNENNVWFLRRWTEKELSGHAKVFFSYEGAVTEQYLGKGSSADSRLDHRNASDMTQVDFSVLQTFTDTHDQKPYEDEIAISRLPPDFGLHLLMAQHYDHLSIFCPGRCSCKKIGVELEAPDPLEGYRISGSAVKLPHHMVFLRAEAEELNRTHMYNALKMPPGCERELQVLKDYPFEPPFRANDWKPELYVSRHCDFLFYNSNIESWLMKWSSNIYTFHDFFPCLDDPFYRMNTTLSFYRKRKFQERQNVFLHLSCLG